MSQAEGLGKLEGIVSNLMTRLDKVVDEKKRLENSLRLSEEDNAALRAEISSLKDDKEHVRQRVDGLLESIEKWEKNLASDSVPDGQAD